MDDAVLVVAATKYGATREIAERIAETLRAEGRPAELADAATAKPPEACRAVVLGSAVYAGSWRKEAAAYLAAHEHALATRPVWLFSSGPTGEGDPVALMKGWRFPEAQQAIADRIQPRGIVLFHGALFPDKLYFAERLVIKAMKVPTGDFRDWKAVEDWAREIAAALRD